MVRNELQAHNFWKMTNTGLLQTLEVLSKVISTRPLSKDERGYLKLIIRDYLFNQI